MIICITGLPGAGKSTAGMILKGMGYRVYELGDIVRQMMGERGIKITAESDREFTVRLRKEHGALVTVKRLLKKVRLGSKSNIAIVGIRSKAELDYIRKRADTVTIAVVAPVRIRFERTKRRGRADAPKTLAEFVRDRDAKEARWGQLAAIKSADYIISGAGNIASLKKAIHSVLENEGAK